MLPYAEHWTSYGQFWLSVAGLVIAVTALFFAALAFRIARREHLKLREEWDRHAEPHVDVELVRPTTADKSISVGAAGVKLVWRILVRNEGNKTAQHCRINVFAPTGWDLQWSDQDGQGMKDPPESEKASKHHEPLKTGDGHSFEADVIAYEAGSISPLDGHINWFSAEVHPTAPGDEVAMIINIGAWSDEMASDAEATSTTDVCIVKWPTNSELEDAGL